LGQEIINKKNQIKAKSGSISLNEELLNVDDDILDLVSDDEDPITKTQLDREIFETNKEIELLEIQRNKLQEEERTLTIELLGWTEPFSELPEERQRELIQAQEGAQGSFGSAIGNIQQAIVDAWIKNILDVMQIDQLMSVLDRFPGGQLVQRYINKVNCSFQGYFNPPLKSFLSTLSFDPCGEGNLGLSFPERTRLPKLPQVFNKSFMTVLRNKFIDKIETIVTQVILRMILKLIEPV
jgi:hypothetical protein